MTKEKFPKSAPSSYCDEIAPAIVASEPARLPPPAGRAPEAHSAPPKFAGDAIE
jgi:hypothetical protein